MLRISVRNFKQLQEQVLARVEKKSEPVLSRRTNNLLNALREATPVDTGEARDSWSRDNVQSFFGRSQGFHAKLRNTASHIVYLNRGWSRQAPSRFIEKTMARFGRVL